MMWALEIASLGEQTRIADNKYRFNNEAIAISLNRTSDTIPCQLRKFRNSFKPEQNWRWKNDVLASWTLKQENKFYLEQE